MNHDPTTLDVLDHCAGSAGLEFDRLLVRRAIDQAVRDHPGDVVETWFDRLKQAGKAAGFRVAESSWAVREAIDAARPTMPVAILRPGEPGQGGRWLVLIGHEGRKARLAGIGYGEADEVVSERALVQRLGLASADEPATWAVLQPIAPCEGLRDPEADDHDYERGHASVSPLWRLLGLIRPEGRDIRVVVAYAVGVGILSLATPLTVEALVSTVAMNLLVQQLVVLALILLACLGLAAAFRALQTFVVEIIQRRLFVRVASDLAYRLPRVRVDAYDHHYGPELVNRFFDVLTVQKIGALLLLDGIAIVLQAAVGLLVLAWYHPYLLGYDLVVLGTMAFIVFQLGRGAVATSIRESRAKYDVAGILEEMARAPVAYKMRGGYDFAMDRADAATRAYLAARQAHFRILFRQVLFALGFQALATSALLGLGGWLVIQKQLTLGQLVAAELIVALVVGSFAKLGKHLEGWYDLMAAVEKLGHLVDLPLERRDGEGHRRDDAASLRLAGVSYGYHEHHDVLHGLDLDVRPGERVAIVGPSGSGKSTLVDLLYGLRAPTAGHIELDGINLRDLDLESLRAHVAAVKGLDIVEESVVENVRMGRMGLSLAVVHDALEAVGLAEEIAELPDGLHTRLVTTGAPLSHGQARRLLLARALVGRPRLLVLDESLDALDLDSRRKVLDALFAPDAPWTLVVVTHVQEVAARCDRAVALADGRAGHSVAMDNGHSRDLEDWLKEVRPWRFT
jgi:putative ABC transport system ATP-binding protein